MTQDMDDITNECGIVYDHDLRTTAHGDGYVTLECLKCGAEIFDEGDEW